MQAKYKLIYEDQKGRALSEHIIAGSLSDAIRKSSNKIYSLNYQNELIEAVKVEDIE